MSVPSWLCTRNVPPPRWSATESWFVDKEGNRNLNSNTVCWAGLEGNPFAKNSVSFAFIIRDYWVNKDTEDCMFLHMVDEAKQIGFEFTYERKGGDASPFVWWEVSVDTTIISGVEIYLLASFFRNIYENPTNIYCYFKLRELYPEESLFTLFILSHYFTFDSLIPRMGHTWMCNFMTYFQDDYLGGEYLTELRKITKPYCENPTYVHPTNTEKLYSVSSSLVGEKATISMYDLKKENRKRPLDFSEEAYLSFFSEEKYKEFMSNPNNRYKRSW